MSCLSSWHGTSQAQSSHSKWPHLSLTAKYHRPTVLVGKCTYPPAVPGSSAGQPALLPPSNIIHHLRNNTSSPQDNTRSPPTDYRPSMTITHPRPHSPLASPTPPANRALARPKGQGISSAADLIDAVLLVLPMFFALLLVARALHVWHHLHERLGVGG